MDYEANAREYVLHALRRDRSVIFARAEGSRLWDIHGKVYLDTMSGSAGPAMVGHANPQVAAARQSRLRLNSRCASPAERKCSLSPAPTMDNRLQRWVWAG